MLVGGFDTTTEKPHLYWLDYLASQAEVPYAAHGYAQYYCLSILDKEHQPDIELDRGLELMRMCRDEVWVPGLELGQVLIHVAVVEEVAD